MKELLNKYLTIRNRNIIAIVVIILGIGFIVNYSFFEPTYINEYIATKVYDAPANSYFDDQNFYNCIIDQYNNYNGTKYSYTRNLTDTQLKKITGLNCDYREIKSIKGVEKLSSLNHLSIHSNQLTEVDISKNIALEYFRAESNQLSELDVSSNLALTDLIIFNNQLTSLDLSNNIELIELSVNGNQLTSLDLSNNTVLTRLDISNNQLTSLDLSNNTALTRLSISNNQLTSLDLSKNVALTELYAYNSISNDNNNQLTSLDLSNNTALTRIEVYRNQLTNLDIGNNSVLNYLGVDNNQLTSLDVSFSSKLSRLKVSYNDLTEIKLNDEAPLYEFFASDNQLEEIHINNRKYLKTIYLSDNKLQKLDLSGATALTRLEVTHNQLTELNVSGATALTDLIAYNNKLENLNVSGATALANLRVNNNELKTLNLSDNIALTTLRVDFNKLTSLDLSKNYSLIQFWGYNNQLTELNVSKNTSLTDLNVSSNQLALLDLSGTTALTDLNVSSNQLEKLDVSNNTNLTSLMATSNKLTSLDVSKNILLKQLWVYDNKLTKLDLSNNTQLSSAIIRNPYMETLFAYKGSDVLATNQVIVPSSLSWDNPVWRSSNTNIATVDVNGLISTIKSGVVDIIGSSGINYTTTSTVNIVEITSDKYLIDEDNNYISIGSDTDIETIKNNVNVSNDNVTIDVDLDNYKLYVKYEDEVLKEFDIIGFYSDEYELNNEYIYVGNNDFNIDYINVINCTKVVEDNKLIIKYNDIVISEYILVSVSSELYDLSNEYIYIGNNDFNIDVIEVTSGIKILEDNKLIIKYNDEMLDEFVLVSISSDNYNLSKNYIYIGIEKFDIDDVIVINGTSVIEDNKLLIKYNDEVLFEYKLMSISFGKYNIFDNNILFSKSVSYDNFISNIETSDSITYKIYNGEDEVTSGDILVGMIIKIYYEDNEIEKYSIIDEFIEFDSSLSVNEDNYIINDIKVGTNNGEILNKISTSGQVSVLDRYDNVILDNNVILGTGFKFKVDLSDYSLEYIVSVKGDINGDGTIDINDIMPLAKHVVVGNYLNGLEYINAADIDNNDKVNINDAIKLAKQIINNN